MRPNDGGNGVHGLCRLLRVLLVVVLAVLISPGTEGFVLAATGSDHSAVVTLGGDEFNGQSNKIVLNAHSEKVNATLELDPSVVLPEKSQLTITTLILEDAKSINDAKSIDGTESVEGVKATDDTKPQGDSSDAMGGGFSGSIGGLMGSDIEKREDQPANDSNGNAYDASGTQSKGGLVKLEDEFTKVVEGNSEQMAPQVVSVRSYVLDILKRAANKFLDEEQAKELAKVEATENAKEEIEKKTEDSNTSHDVRVSMAYVAEVVDDEGHVVYVPEDLAKLTYTFEGVEAAQEGGRFLSVQRKQADKDVAEEELPAWNQAVSPIIDATYPTEEETSLHIRFEAVANAAEKETTATATEQTTAATPTEQPISAAGDQAEQTPDKSAIDSKKETVVVEGVRSLMMVMPKDAAATNDTVVDNSTENVVAKDDDAKKPDAKQEDTKVDAAKKDDAKSDGAKAEDAKKSDVAAKDSMKGLASTKGLTAMSDEPKAAPIVALGDSGGTRATSLPSFVYPKTNSYPTTGINNPANTTIDLFDYWITSQDASDYNNGDENAGYGNYVVYNSGINKQHLLLFHGGSGGQHPSDNASDHFTGMYGGAGNDKWTSPSQYWGPVIQGIVQNRLDSRGYPKLRSTNEKKTFKTISGEKDSAALENRTFPYFMDTYPFTGGGHTYNLNESVGAGTTNESLEYLFNPSTGEKVRKNDGSFSTYKSGETNYVAGKASYPNIDGLFSVDNAGYYIYDSGRQAAAYKEKKNRFELSNHASGSSGFWPLDSHRTDGKHNGYIGMHMKMSFSIPANGEVLNPQGQYVPMSFTFAGDDDVWVFVDDVLVGDVGGIHQPSSLNIDFKTGDVKINQNFEGITCPTIGSRGSQTDSPEYVPPTNLKAIFQSASPSAAQKWKGNTFADNTYHTIDFFYLERGNNESNLQIRFNMVNTTDFTAHKALIASGENLQHDQFKFELTGLPGVWQRDDSGNATLKEGTDNVPAIKPKDAESFTSNPPVVSAGDVGRYYESDDANKRWTYRVGASADGNVNFGNADFTLVTTGEYSLGNSFRYIVREVPPDSTYDYDSRVYYMEATIAQDKTTKKYYLSKTYYTDDSFTTPVADTRFISFVNLGKNEPRAVPEITVSKNLKRYNKNSDITAGQFTFELVNDKNEVVGYASCGASVDDSKVASAKFTLPRLTQIDFWENSEYIRSFQRTYRVREVIPSSNSQPVGC